MSERFQILSLDGGGLKGLFSAAVLAHIEEDRNINIADHFDLIVGTSTGGIIALGLGAGLRPREILDFYVEQGPRIFPHPRLRKVRQLFGPKYSGSTLQGVLKDRFGDRLLGQSGKRLVIPSYNIGEDDVYLFKTPHHTRLGRDWRVPMWKVAMATSAAPTFLPTFREVNQQRLVDGGVWANNPAMVGIVEAVATLDQSFDSLRLFSLGTTNEVKGRPKGLDHGGALKWAFSAHEVILRGQSIGAFNQAKSLLPDGNAVRFDPPVATGLFQLDSLSMPDLLAKAAHESRIFVPKFMDVFADHQAAPYQPLYS
ncbi:MAG: patatin-like phospholipase family protein [Armatimonadetes bacterium]|nr:patatin-like phospholipase family protein [Armatimonadota bacterium]